MKSTTVTETIDEKSANSNTNHSNLQCQISSSVTYKLRATANWVKKPFKERNFWERLASLDLASDKCYIVQVQNSNPPPKLSVWQERLWLTMMIAPALMIQAFWYYITPETSFFHTWHPIIAFIFYHLAFVVYTLKLIKHLTDCMDFYGTFDEHQRPRDYVPDKDV